MKILITGANGLLGTYLVREMLKSGHTVLATGLGTTRFRKSEMGSGKLNTGEEGRLIYASLDIRDAMAVRDTVMTFRPHWILHCAAWAQPDLCETQPIDCWSVNVTATRFLVQAAGEAGASFLFLSTDFVFDGKSGPYSEEDAPSPVNYYGCTKKVAEKAVMESSLHWVIVRTVLVYGQSPSVQRFNLLTWVRDKLNAGERIRVVNDQYRTPTYAGDLARGIRQAIGKNASGIFHMSGKDFLTPYDMAVATAKTLHLDDALIEPVTASTFTQPAMRPPRTGFIINKAIHELGYRPLSFPDGLLYMLEHDPA